MNQSPPSSAAASVGKACLRPGLTSITFRQLSPEEIIALAAEAGIAGIEWGGDVHVPHGDLARARAVSQATAAAGLCIPVYGSYYRVGHGAEVPFADVLATACEMGAPTIRIWAGKIGSEQADATHRDAVIAETRRLADAAASHGLNLTFEFHGGTLTDTVAATSALLRDLVHPHVLTHWQPPVGMDPPACLNGLRELLPHLSHLHAFHWRERQRLPLAEGAEEWRQYLAVARQAQRELFVTLEFVKDNDPQAFRDDARTLRQLLAEANQAPPG